MRIALEIIKRLTANKCGEDVSPARRWPIAQINNILHTLRLSSKFRFRRPSSAFSGI